MAFLLHQSSVIFGVNLSLSDLFCIVIFFLLLNRNQLYIPTVPFVFFLTISILVLMTALILVPRQFMYTPEPAKVLADYIKLGAVFVYFLIGYNLDKLKLLKKTLSYYSFSGIGIGLLGIGLTFLNIQSLTEFLYFAGIRYKGLMIDPNYFSVLQVTAFVFISRSAAIKARYKWLALFIIVLSILVSGSKTGLLTLFIYLAFRLAEYIFLTRKRAGALIMQMIVFVLVLAASPIIFGIVNQLLLQAVSSIPSLERLQFLFTDFNQAFSESGSGRNTTWEVAVQIIQASPVFGIGIGTYSNLAYELFDSYNVSHNTFLQLLAEWGILAASLFFAAVFSMLGKVTFSYESQSETTIVLRDILLILLIGSLAISLNNARFFWLCLGALISSLQLKYESRKAINKVNGIEGNTNEKNCTGSHAINNTF